MLYLTGMNPAINSDIPKNNCYYATFTCKSPIMIIKTTETSLDNNDNNVWKRVSNIQWNIINAKKRRLKELEKE